MSKNMLYFLRVETPFLIKSKFVVEIYWQETLSKEDSHKLLPWIFENNSLIEHMWMAVFEINYKNTAQKDIYTHRVY